MLKLPDPVHAQLKALAAARGTTMVDVIANTLRQAVEAGEIKPESAGLSVSLVFDLDSEDEAGRGPWAVIKTNDGDMAYMSREEATYIADSLLADGPLGPMCFTHNRYGAWSLEVRGTAFKLYGLIHAVEESGVTVTMAPVVAKTLGQQLRKLAPQLGATARR